MIPTDRIAGCDRDVPSEDVADRVPASGAASLEQLRTCSRELEGGILFVDAGGSSCLVDPRHRQFGRTGPQPARDADVIGSWHPYDDLFRDGDDLVIVPSAGAVRIRIRPSRTTG
jgi:hypothetical protein